MKELKLLMENKLKMLIESAKAEGKDSVVMQILDDLMSERIHIVGNNMRKMLERKEKTLDKEAVTSAIKRLNKIASDLEEEFYIKEDWENIEYFLKSTLLEDISKEFQRQSI